MTFSGGVFDLILFGIIPDATGFATKHYHIYWLGAIYAVIYYYAFYFAINKFDIPTPGRVDGNIKLASKADYQAKKTTRGNDRSARVELLADNLGGLDNLVSIDACITRLRLTIKDRSLVQDKALTDMGAAGVVGKGTAIQVVFGAEADIFKTELKKLKK